MSDAYSEKHGFTNLKYQTLKASALNMLNDNDKIFLNCHFGAFGERNLF